MRASPGFRMVRCQKCHSEYEIAVNVYVPSHWSPICQVKTFPGSKCGGRLDALKNSGPMKILEPELASKEDGDDLEQFLQKL